MNDIKDSSRGDLLTERHFTALEAADKDGWAYMPGEIEALGRIAICVMVMRDGRAAVGTSVCADPGPYDADAARAVARERAVEALRAAQTAVMVDNGRSITDMAGER